MVAKKFDYYGEQPRQSALILKALTKNYQIVLITTNPVISTWEIVLTNLGRNT